MRIVLVAGYRHGGKTTAIAKLTRALARKGRRVGVLKHIHQGNISLDSRGKDTWVLSRAGANVVVAASPTETVIFNKSRGDAAGLDLAMKYLRTVHPDYLFVEGYNALVERRKPTTVICARTMREVDALVEHHPNATFICGRVAERSRSRRHNGLPLIRLNEDMPIALSLIA